MLLIYVAVSDNDVVGLLNDIMRLTQDIEWFVIVQRTGSFHVVLAF